MSKWNYVCELCGKEEKTICYGVARMCRECLEEELGENIDVETFTKKRDYETLDDCARECGNYYNLVNLLYCIGKLTGADMGYIIETLDDMFEETAI